jgi:hypothetical protein
VGITWNVKSCVTCKSKNHVEMVGMEWEERAPVVLMFCVAWENPELDGASRSHHSSKTTMDNEVTVLGTKYTYVGTIMHMDTPRHFYTIISHNGQVWGPPSRDSKVPSQGDMVDHNAVYYISYGDLPYVTRDDGAYPILHCYIKEQIEEVDGRLEE